MIWKPRPLTKEIKSFHHIQYKLFEYQTVKKKINILRGRIMGVVTETLEITHSTLECPFQLFIFVSKLLYSLKLSVFFCVCEKSITVSSSQHCYNDEGEGMYGKHLGNGSPTHKVAAAASTTNNMNLNSNGFPPDRSVFSYSKLL